MELVVAAIVDEHDNKENFPPGSAEKFVPKQSKDKLFKKKKRNVREPLRDITHLFENVPAGTRPISDSQFNHLRRLLHRDASSNGSKRNASDEDETGIRHSQRKKSAMVLRKHFR